MNYLGWTISNTPTLGKFTRSELVGHHDVITNVFTAVRGGTTLGAPTLALLEQMIHLRGLQDARERKERANDESV